MTTCPSQDTPGAALSQVEWALAMPPDDAAFLDETFRGAGRSSWWNVPVKQLGRNDDHFAVSSQEPGRHVEMEYLRLERGVWLVFGEFQLDEPIVQWHRQRGELTFVTLLHGASMITAASATQQRSYCAEGHVIGTASTGDALVCRYIPADVKCQAVSLVFDGDDSLERFGLDAAEVRRWLDPQESAHGARPTFQAAIGAPNPLVLKTAQAMLWTRFTGRRRALYLRSKAGELMCHLLATPANAHAGIDIPAIAPKSDDSLAAIAHAALSDPDDGPEVRDLADRLQVSAGRLVAAFRSKYGISPREHLTAARLTRAKRLVEQTHMPIIDIALACGYEHHSSFSTAYRRTFGETPMEARRAVGRSGGAAVNA